MDPDGQIDWTKKSMVAYGSILLGELNIILSVIEHLITNHEQLHQEKISLFSNIQTGVDILTLNWAIEHFQEVFRKIKEFISTLKSRAWNIEIVWSLGQSEGGQYCKHF